MKLSHAEWLERKERDLEDERYEKMMQDRRKKLQETARKEKSQKQFDEWLLHKENFERATTLLGQLAQSRREEEKDWFEVAVSLNAVDCLRGVYKEDGFNGLPTDRDPSHNVSRDVLKKRKTLEEEFYKWSRDQEHGHEFENIPVDTDLAKTFTLNTQEIMSEYAEQLDKAGEYIIPNLKFSAPKVKQAAHDKRNLFNPDKVKYNKIFNKLLRIEYRKAQQEMYNRLDKQVGGVGAGSLAAAEKRVLSAMGLGRLAKWVEEDISRADEIIRARKEEDKEYAKKVHEGFVNKKNRMRVRLPEQEADDDDDIDPKRKQVLFGSSGKENATIRMDFSTGKKVAVRKRSKAAKNSVEILSRSGTANQKYAYCTNKRDLEMARSHLAKQGHIYQENFKDEDGDALASEYHSAKQQDTKLTRISKRVREREEKAAETYKDWATQKELRSRAIQALDHIDRPGKTGEGAATDEAQWRFVGEQLKSVDQTLLGKFSEWSNGYKSAAQCKATWELLPPNVCDTCCPSATVHNVLLKLLNRPGMDFQEVFEFGVDNELRKMMASDGRSLDEATEEERQTVRDTLQLDRKSFRKMMNDAGIKLQTTDVRILTTLFDEDGDGKISRKEFLQFTGYDPRPGARGEAIKILRGGNLCCWEACCHVTGMVNAYDVMPANEDEENYESEECGLRTLPLRLRTGVVKKGWVRVPLPDLERRMKKLIRLGERTLEDFTKGSVPKSCEVSTWTNNQRTSALEGLETLAKHNKEITTTLAAQKEGEPPLAPVLLLGKTDSLVELDRQTSLILSWKPQHGSVFPSFYILECAGKEGSRSHRNHDYKEIFRDPPSAASGSDQLGEFSVTKLDPGTRYFFRIRAFNGYGHSPYTYASYATAPPAPALPLVQSSTPTTLTVSWGDLESGMQTKCRELRDIFRAIDLESTGYVDRDALIDGIENANPTLMDFLEETPSPTIPGTSILDMIEAVNEGDQIKWSDVKSWMTASSGNKSSSRKSKSARSYQYLLCRCVSDEEVNFKVEGAIGKNRTTNDVVCSVIKSSEWFMNRAVSDTGEVVGGSKNRFELPPLDLVELPENSSVATEKPALRIVTKKATRSSKLRQQKTSPAGGARPKELTTTLGSLTEPVVHLEVYEQVYVGSETSCTLTGLHPGESLQLRVFIINRAPVGTGDQIAPTALNVPADVGANIASRMSPGLIVHLPSVAPPGPKVVKTITADTVSLAWERPDLEQLSQKSKAKESVDAKKDDWTKVVGEWAQDPSAEFKGGVSESTLRKTFMRYDKDSNGTLDGNELVELFQDLGIRTSGASFEQAKNNLDTNGDNLISYQEFSRWWKKNEMQFLLLHRVVAEGTSRKPPWKIVYRGSKTEAQISGLEPNTKHCFALQCEMNRNVSTSSAETVVYTAPETPQQPVIIEAGPKHFRVKWYPGHGLADRYILECLYVEKLPDDSVKPASSRKKQGEWKEVYNGKSTIALISGLDVSTMYRLRVKAQNKGKITSTTSLPAQFPTASIKTNLDKRASKANAASYFEIECTGNIVVGDTILFTERVFAKGVDSTNASRRKKPVGASLSQQSMSSLDVVDKKRGTFVSERTVAARTVNSSTDRKTRTLTMEVLWTSLSVKSASPKYDLHPGARITRTETELFKFETFRARWAQEDARWSHNEEIDAGLE